MVNNKTYCAINLIQIYQVDSAIHPSNNRVCFSRGLGSRPGRNFVYFPREVFTRSKWLPSPKKIICHR